MLMLLNKYWVEIGFFILEKNYYKLRYMNIVIVSFLFRGNFNLKKNRIGVEWNNFIFIMVDVLVFWYIYWNW